ncbi:MAG: glycosyltransferase N-terminal domain-containing protein [Verrucomicrobiota bacterium JB023]|nr:glycosyltransferase N-terminal domain-containing protein [Verrucomicrobiota bacterium JB023]
MFRHLYNLLLPGVAAMAAPFWLLKTRKRGGLSQRLWEKLSLYHAESPPPTQGVIYLHAVSVGEANIALKLVQRWHERDPSQHFLLALGTSTGFDHAKASAGEYLQVLYAPLDFPASVSAMLDRYEPKLIVLIEHEVWPNLIYETSRRGIPVALANARLSPRSGRRLAKLRPLLGQTYEPLAWVGAQVEDDVERLAAIGIRPATIAVTGSIKFDPATTTPVVGRFDPRPFLSAIGGGPVLMALSTHPGEERLFAQAASQVQGARVVIIPRHMERRGEIEQELREDGHAVRLRSRMDPSERKEGILVVDSTGEMPAFTTQARVVFVGKSLLAHGGQNPCEAIAAGVPVVAGPHLENFEPLAEQLREVEGIATVNTVAELSAQLRILSTDTAKAATMTTAAQSVLEQHKGATDRTIDGLQKLLPNLPAAHHR